MSQAYRNIFRRSGLPILVVEADSGAIGGKDSQEFILPAEAGEDTILHCPGCGYAANVERASFKLEPLPHEEQAPLEEIATPGAKTIEDLAQLLAMPQSKTLKAVFYMAGDRLVFVVIRGDLDVNEIKLSNVLKATDLRMASDEEVAEAGIVAGSASPIGLKDVTVVVDESANTGNNFVVGANRDGYHFRNANFPRDFQATLVADVALAKEGYTCSKCESKLEAIRGIEVGHIFKLGTFYSERLEAGYLDEHGNQHPMVMGCYGIGVGRLLAAAIEQNHDEKGIVFPPPIAPYQVHLLSLNPENSEVYKTAEDLYRKLQEAGLEVLYDDREESAGVKFNDADLLGLPLRLVVSPRNLRQASIELKGRLEEKGTLAPIESAVETVKSTLGQPQ